MNNLSEEQIRKLRGLMIISGTGRGSIDHPNEEKVFKYVDKIIQEALDKQEEDKAK